MVKITVEFEVSVKDMQSYLNMATHSKKYRTPRQMLAEIIQEALYDGDGPQLEGSFLCVSEEG